MRPPRRHALGDNRINRSPRRVVVLDTETRWHDVNGRELHQLRCWCTRTLHREPANALTLWGDVTVGTDATALVDHLEDVADDSCTTWLYAHNLGFDLVVTRLLLRLLERGWTVGRHALTLDSPWAQLRKGRRRLTLADSLSVLPASVERLGRDMGIPKLALPDTDDSLEAWQARCDADVSIVAAALAELMDWWDRNRLGCWSLTGAACGWNAYRHRKSFTSVTIDPVPEARAFERRAINAGRREVWHVGQLPPARYVEVDISRAHLTAAYHFDLPCRRGERFGPVPISDRRVTLGRHGSIAEVTVRTDTPRYPCVIDRRTFYPVGEFRTVLCGPELSEALARGELVAVHGGYRYRLAPTMRVWAGWLAGILDGQCEDAPPMAWLAAKSWSRRVPGKWATRTSERLMLLPSAEHGWKIERGVHHPSDARCALLHLAGKAELLLQDQEGDDSFPAVLAWIQSLTRVAVSRLVDAVGSDRMVSVNTDGIILRAHRGPDMVKLAAACAPFTPRIKGTYRHVDVLSPQHLILDGVPRLSGIPRSATSSAGAGWSWRTWPRFAAQLEHGSPAGYVREPRSVSLADVPVNRWVLVDGSTRPPRAILSASGARQLVHPASDPAAAEWPALRPVQHPTLARLEPGLLVAGGAGAAVSASTAA